MRIDTFNNDVTDNIFLFKDELMTLNNKSISIFVNLISRTITIGLEDNNMNCMNADRLEFKKDYSDKKELKELDMMSYKIHKDIDEHKINTIKELLDFLEINITNDIIKDKYKSLLEMSLRAKDKREISKILSYSCFMIKFYYIHIYKVIEKYKLYGKNRILLSNLVFDDEEDPFPIDSLLRIISNIKIVNSDFNIKRDNIIDSSVRYSEPYTKITYDTIRSNLTKLRYKVLYFQLKRCVEGLYRHIKNTEWYGRFNKAEVILDISNFKKNGLYKSVDSINSNSSIFQLLSVLIPELEPNSEPNAESNYLSSLKWFYKNIVAIKYSNRSRFELILNDYNYSFKDYIKTNMIECEEEKEYDYSEDPKNILLDFGFNSTNQLITLSTFHRDNSFQLNYYTLIV